MEPYLCQPSSYYSSQIKKLKLNSKKYHELLKQFLSNYKVHPCIQQTNHNIETCFYYHDKTDCRRNPYRDHQLLYTVFEICDCLQAECPRIHNQYESLYHPLIYKTNQCPKQSICEFGFYCYCSHPQDLIHFEYGQFFRFDLRTFKTEKCYKKNPHERKTCLYYHNDKDKRRPSNISYDHFICENFKCNNELCQFSHNKLEQLYHVNRYKTKFCHLYPNEIEKCEYRNFCSFAHCIDQIISNIELLHLLERDQDFYVSKYKTVWCPFTQNHSRDKCPYAHNIQDYRRNPLQYDYKPVRCQFWNFSDEIKSIDGAGCKLGIECKKCHGWMEQRYHPSVYTKKRNFSLKKEKIEEADNILSKKLTDMNLLNEFKTKVKTNRNPQISKKNYQKGTPFFKSDKATEYTAKTKAKSVDCSSNKDLVKKDGAKTQSLTQKNIFAYPSLQEDLIDWDVPLDSKDSELKNQNSARSKSAQKSEQYENTYSKSIQNELDISIIGKLKNNRFNQIQIVNMKQDKIEKLSFLNEKQKSTLAVKLKAYNMKQIDRVTYSIELTKYFVTKKKEKILQKMQEKKVKQAKLLKLVAKQINQLSFLEAEEKIVLPKLIKQFRNEKQFNEINQSIVEETKVK